MKNTYEKAVAVQDLINTAQKIVIVQADNPDADSLGSALALDHILADMGKQPVLYCGVDMPGYLHYMQGWDRVEKELPPTFDSSIIVDASTMSLLERLIQSGQQTWLAAKPCLVLDHHETVDNIIPFSQVMVNDSLRASTGELIYLLAKQLDWAMSIEAQEYLMASILGDTQGLSNQLASAETYRVMAAMTEIGVNRPALEEKRRLYSRMPQIIYKYKAELIKRTEFDHEGRVATVVVTQPEINKFSPLYNPAPLVQNDMLQTSDVMLSAVFKTYADGRITAAIRSNPTAGICGELAAYFGGGGHAFASGFKINGGRSYENVKIDFLAKSAELLDGQDRKIDEAV